MTNGAASIRHLRCGYLATSSAKAGSRRCSVSVNQPVHDCSSFLNGDFGMRPIIASASKNKMQRQLIVRDEYEERVETMHAAEHLAMSG
jgi:hypothetical protein